MPDHRSDWIEGLVASVADCIEAYTAMGSLGYWYSTEEGMVELVIYPTPVELVGGAVDGAVVVPGFSLDLHTLQTAFDQVDAVQWCPHSFGLHDDEGPHLSLEGIYRGHQVWLRVLSEPPEDEEPGLLLDTSATG